MLQPVVPLSSKSMISSSSFVLRPSILSLSSMQQQQQQQQQRSVLHSRRMDIRRKRHITTNRNNNKCSYITKTKSIATFTKYNRPSERIVYLPIMKTSTICTNNYSTKQFVIECFIRK
ncbi:hypothetical protein DINM_000336 [Dirofilaria immitis]|nr:hypothetical protein [Dirofilaria immitis]